MVIRSASLWELTTTEKTPAATSSSSSTEAMEQDLSTILDDSTEVDAGMGEMQYDPDRDSRDNRERERDPRDDNRERDTKDRLAAPPGEGRYSQTRSPGRDRSDRGAVTGQRGHARRGPYDRAEGDGFARGPSSKTRLDPNRPSRKECRVYVGNLAYETGWQDLKDYMRKVGEVVFADIILERTGRSKGCGVVEFATPEDAQKAIQELNDTPFMGRQVFIREDREQEPKFGSGGQGAFRDAGRALFVNNLPYVVAWQDLKDLFRQAGNVIRADVMEGPDRRSKGMGIVVFETIPEAQHAISMFDGFDWHGRRLEVREERGGPPPRGPPPAPYGRGYERPPRDYYGGGYGGGYGPKDYYGGGGGGGYDGGYGGYGAYDGYYDRGYGGDYGPPVRGDYFKDYHGAPPPPPPPGPYGGGGGRGSYGPGDGRSAPPSAGYGDRAYGYHR
ncbi:hypothetical protein BC832DRAFT_544185 [Gaertneriomyces semiglobifer]|nr:hypothetical protein BC832DRAFT_544185 [Gaertneriomyces semiglobifer]